MFSIENILIKNSVNFMLNVQYIKQIYVESVLYVEHFVYLCTLKSNNIRKWNH